MDLDLESTGWVWGLLLIAATTIVHAVGVVMIAGVMLPIRTRLPKRQDVSRRDVLAIVFVVVAVVGLLLTMLHLVEIAMWAAAYLGLAALPTVFDAMLFSLGAMTTAGAPGLSLPRHWQMMGLLEAVNGALLFGISTAYMFAVLQAYWSLHRPVED